LEEAKASLAKTQAEVEDLSQSLAQEKMARAEAEASLDAAKNQKPDTSEADGLKGQLATLQATHTDSIKALETENTGYLAMLDEMKSDLLMAQKDLEAHQLEATAKIKTSEADYKDMHDSMTQLVEEAQTKVTDLEAKLTEAIKVAADKEKMFDELEAQIKVKDAELAEAKVGFVYWL
jgi:chromosome segregation ATPase